MNIIVSNAAPTELETEWAHLVRGCLSLSLSSGPVSLHVFHLFSPFQLTLTRPPSLSTLKPHLSSPPSPISSPPSRWVWLSSLYRGRWGHKTAGEAPMRAQRQGVCVCVCVINYNRYLSSSHASCAHKQTHAVINLGPVTVCWCVKQ